MMYGIELWGVYDAWKETDKIHGRFCKKISCVPRCAANGAAEIELGRESRRGKTESNIEILAKNFTYGQPRVS
jgi:hypothetical protein